MKTYELTYIITPEITPEEAHATAKEIENAVQSKEGTILKQTIPSAKTLAYPVAKRASGFLGVLEFQIEPEKLEEVKKTIEKNEKISRHMLLTKNPTRIKKERRGKIKPFSAEQKTEIEKKEQPVLSKHQQDVEKVDLKNIDQQLDEILGE